MAMDIKKLVCAVMLGSMSSAVFAGQDSLGLPGDNLDLRGVLEIFKKSNTLEEFEKNINDPSSEVNNLDLNGDNEVDYIRVIDHSNDKAHAIALQVPVSETESQDVAVIELEKTGDEKAQVQIVGDEDIYGKDYIIEPAADNATKLLRSYTPGGAVVNVWVWPSVRYIFGPKYVVWVSPWKWKAYPGWWKPWKPVVWHVHHKRVVRYHVHHHRVHVHRAVYAHKVYRPHRVTSVVVHNRHHKGKPHHEAHGPAGKKGHHGKHAGPKGKKGK
jgi:hypothetical protein